jgi:hypothetical protein
MNARKIVSFVLAAAVVVSNFAATIAKAEPVVFGVPTADSQSVATSFNTGVVITLVGHVLTAEPVEPVLTYGIFTGPSNGSVDSSKGNPVTYTPNDGFVGTDSFTFYSQYNSVKSNPATVSVTVVPCNPDTTPVPCPAPKPEPCLPTSVFPCDEPKPEPCLPFSVIPCGDPEPTPCNPDTTPVPCPAPKPTPCNPDTTAVPCEAPKNHAPVAYDGDATTSVDQEVTIILQATDEDGDTLKYTIAGPDNGVLSPSALPTIGAYTYTPKPQNPKTPFG